MAPNYIFILNRYTEQRDLNDKRFRALKEMSERIESALDRSTLDLYLKLFLRPQTQRLFFNMNNLNLRFGEN